MKRLFCALAALSLIIAVAEPAVAAEGYAKKKHSKKYARAHSRHSAAGTYIERDANKLPYGTGIWWEQMDREGRGGQSGGGSGGRN